MVRNQYITTPTKNYNYSAQLTYLSLIHICGRSKDADFILQTVEVDARLASHGSVDHGEQRSGNVDVGDAPLEGCLLYTSRCV